MQIHPMGGATTSGETSNNRVRWGINASSRELEEWINMIRTRRIAATIADSVAVIASAMPPTESAMVAVDSFDLFKLAHSVFTFFKF
jgi:hypothetical protein